MSYIVLNNHLEDDDEGTQDEDDTADDALFVRLKRVSGKV